MIRHAGVSNLVCAVLVVACATSGCGGGGGGGSGNSVSGTTSTTLTSASSTTTTSTTIADDTTTTTFDDASTTTTLGGGDLYTITFVLEDAVTIGALQVEVDYGAAGGDFVGSAAAVSCSWSATAGGVLSSFGDVDASSQLNFAAISGTGFSGPVTLASCTFAASGPAPVESDFAITVVEAHGPGLAPIAPLPTVSVSAISPQ